MTETMLERVAKELCANVRYCGGDPREIVENKPRWVQFVPAAFFAIEAMRDRTDAMIAAIGDRDGDAFDADWRSSIDAALSETEGG